MDTWLICFFKFRFWSKIIPKYFVDSNSSVGSQSISSFILRGGFFLTGLKITKFDFLTFSDNLFDNSHCKTFSNSSLRVS